MAAAAAGLLTERSREMSESSRGREPDQPRSEPSAGATGAAQEMPPVAPATFYGGSGGRPAGEPPASVRTVTILLYVAAALAFLGGGLSLILAPVSAQFLFLAVALIVVGVAYIVLTGKLRQRNRTARTVAVILSGLSLVANLLQLRRTALSGLIGIALNGAIIYLLMFHPDSRRFFGDPV